MKKSIATILAGTFLALVICQTGHADSGRVSTEAERLPLALGKAVSPSHERFPEKNTLVLLPFPFLSGEKAESFHAAKNVLPLFTALLSMKEWLARGASAGNARSGYLSTRSKESAFDRARKIFDSKELTAQEYMGISLNRGVGRTKQWRLFLDLGIALGSDGDSFRYTGTSTDAVSEIQSIPYGRGMDFLDQVRNGTPIVGLGVSYRF